MNALSRARAFALELKRRKVYHAALAYVSAGVVVVLAAAELYEVLLLPDWTPRFVLLLVVAGLPVALVVAWAYDLRPEETAPAASAGLAGRSQVTAATEPAPTGDDRPGIVVLPFDNLSSDPADEYFSSGLTEEVTADLAALSGLRVLSRTSATQLKASDRDARSFARELGVQYLMEGSVRKAGDRVRVTAQLIDAASDAHVWVRKYDGTFDEVFEIQEGVARAVVEALRVELSATEERALSAIPVANVRAYERYLRARNQIQRFTPAGLDKAVAYLEEARREVGENAAILGGLAYAHAQYVNLGHGQEELVDRAEEFARRAIELDPRSAEGLYVLGFIALWFRADVGAAVRYLERAAEARPDESHALIWLAVAYAQLGRIGEARETAARLVAVDPLNPMNHAVPGAVELYAGRFDAAAASMETAIDGDPDNPGVQMFYALSLFFLRRRRETVEFVDSAADPDRGTSMDSIMLLLRHACDGDPEGMEAIVTQPDCYQTLRRDPQLSWFTASAFACAGDLETALDWISNAVDRGFLNASYLAEHDPFFVPLRGNRRFQAVVKQARLEAEHTDRMLSAGTW